jgi:hypothetical protein
VKRKKTLRETPIELRIPGMVPGPANGVPLAGRCGPQAPKAACQTGAVDAGSQVAATAVSQAHGPGAIAARPMTLKGRKMARAPATRTTGIARPAPAPRVLAPGQRA